MFSDFQGLGNSKHRPYRNFFHVQDGESISGGLFMKSLKTMKGNYFNEA